MRRGVKRRLCGERVEDMLIVFSIGLDLLYRYVVVGVRLKSFAIEQCMRIFYTSTVGTNPPASLFISTL